MMVIVVVIVKIMIICRGLIKDTVVVNGSLW